MVWFAGKQMKFDLSGLERPSALRAIFPTPLGCFLCPAWFYDDPINMINLQLIWSKNYMGMLSRTVYYIYPKYWDNSTP